MSPSQHTHIHSDTHLKTHLSSRCWGNHLHHQPPSYTSLVFCSTSKTHPVIIQHLIFSLLFDVIGWVSPNWGWIILRRFTSVFSPLCCHRWSTDSGFIPPVVFEGIISLDWKRPLLSCQAHRSRCELGFRRARADTFINMTPCFVLLASFWLAMAFELETGKLIGLRLMHGNEGFGRRQGGPGRHMTGR